MNIIQAAATGKPFKRKDWHTYLTVQRYGKGPNEIAYLFSEGIDPKLRPEDLQAEDWEVYDHKITITFEDLKKAYADACAKKRHPAFEAPSVVELAKELGFPFPPKTP